LATAPSHEGGAAPWLAFGALLALRVAGLRIWQRRLAARLRGQALAAAVAAGRACQIGTVLALVPLIGAWVAPGPAGWVVALQALAGALAAGAGVAFKWTLVTRAAYNQGFAIAHLPVRGVPRS